MPLQTLHLTNAWHQSSGGIATFYRALLSAANAEWRVDLVVPGAASGTERLSPFATIHTVEAPTAPFSPNYRFLYPSSFLTPNGPLQRILRSVQPDVVETTDKYSLVYLAGLLRVGWIHDLDQRPALVGLSCERMDDNLRAYTSLTESASALAQTYMRLVYFRQFDHHIAVSSRTAEELRQASIGHKRSRGIWIRGMGVDLAVFDPSRRRAETRNQLLQRCQAEDSTVLLLYAGRLAPEKNLRLLAEMLQHLPELNLRMLVAGDGPSRDQFVADMAAHFPGRFVYLGHQSNRDRFADLLANVDVFVHPNPREPFGIGPLEAMASGTPLIAPNQGGVTEYATLGNAWLYEPTGQQFSAAVRSILFNSAVRAHRIAEALHEARRHSWPSVAAQFRALYLDLAARTSGTLASVPQEPHFWSTPIGGIDTAL